MIFFVVGLAKNYYSFSTCILLRNREVLQLSVSFSHSSILYLSSSDRACKRFCIVQQSWVTKVTFGNDQLAVYFRIRSFLSRKHDHANKICTGLRWCTPYIESHQYV